MTWQNTKTDFGDPSGSKLVSVGQDTWNIADGYTKIKILRLLIELDLYETIASFGYKDLDETNSISPNIVVKNRIEGLNRVCFCLKQVIGNCRFSIEKSKKSKILLDSYNIRIENVEKVLDGVFYQTYNDLTKEYETYIDEEHFKKCFSVLRNIKDEINFPINTAGLIFRQSDEIDLDKMMNDIVYGG